MWARLPFLRLALAALVGAVACSALRFYTAFGAEMADLTGDAPTERRAVADHFLRDFLFAGTEATVLFWSAVALLALGIVRNLTSGGKGAPNPY